MLADGMSGSRRFSRVLGTNDALGMGEIASGFAYDMKHKIAYKVTDSLVFASFIRAL